MVTGLMLGALIFGGTTTTTLSTGGNQFIKLYNNRSCTQEVFVNTSNISSFQEWGEKKTRFNTIRGGYFVLCVSYKELVCKLKEASKQKTGVKKK